MRNSPRATGLSVIRAAVLTAITMIAFAGNSLLCRVALATTEIDAASFTTLRLLSGAVTLTVLAWATGGKRSAGNWRSAFALFAYAAGFSFAYLTLTAATGALLLFGAVQCTMIGYGLFRGERPGLAQSAGILVAVAGLIGLLWPGLSAPPPGGAALMLAAGVAWGIYSLRGRRAADPLGETAGNFVRAVPLGAMVSAIAISSASPDLAGGILAMVSGALASGVGYAIWYTVLPALKATTAATVQLSVPPLAALGGVVFLAEPFSLRLALASLAILGGIAVCIFGGGTTPRGQFVPSPRGGGEGQGEGAPRKRPAKKTDGP
jgi:drug/metabolite transporter (DMT)-like permease